MNPNQLSQETLDALKAARQNPNEELAKAFTQSGSATTGLTAYDLEAPAKNLYPVLTPLRNIIPRVSGAGGIQANWKAVTAINSTRVGIGVAEGARGGVISTATADYNAAYKGIGLEDSVTFEAQYAGQNYEDIKARAALGLLQSVMIGEEGVLLGGNNSLALGTPTAPTLATSSSGGTIGAITLSVIVVALTLEGFLGASVAGGVPVSGNRTQADGSVQSYNTGHSQKSAAAASGALTGSTNSATASTPVVAGAAAYAWYWGTAGNEVLGAITTINSVSIKANATGTQNASVITVDGSQNSFLFDGLLTMAAKASLNATVITQATGTAGTGTPLTPDGKGGVTEIDAVLLDLWTRLKLSPDCIWVSAQEARGITLAVLTGSSNQAFRFNFEVNQQGMAGSANVSSYLNKYSMSGVKDIPIRIHPNMPAGQILFTTSVLPYQMNGVTNVMQVKTRQEYYQIEWPLRTRKYEYGVYADEVLQHYFPASLGLIRNIAPTP